MFLCSVFWAFFWGEKRLKNGRFLSAFFERFWDEFGSLKNVPKTQKIISKTLEKRLKNGYLKKKSREKRSENVFKTSKKLQKRCLRDMSRLRCSRLGLGLGKKVRVRVRVGHNPNPNLSCHRRLISYRHGEIWCREHI